MVTQGNEPSRNKLKFPLFGGYVESKMPTSLWLVKPLRNTLVMPPTEVKINWINANDVTAENGRALSDADGIIARWFWPTWYGRENPSYPLCA